MKYKYITGVLIAGASLFIANSVIDNNAASYTPRQSKKIDAKYRKETGYERSIKQAIENYRLIRANQITGEVAYEDVMAAYAEAANRPSYRLNKNLVWQNLGPDNYGGRCRAFLIDKDNPNLMFVGGVSGGLFRSTTRGSSWIPVNDMQENLNVVSITQSNDGTIFYGTGENAFLLTGFGVNGTKAGTPGFMGSGIFVSTDKGLTFTPLASTQNNNFQYVSTMATKPGTNRVYAGTNAGLWYTENGGSTWTKITNASPALPNNCREIKFGPDGAIWVHSGNGVFKSNDGLTNFNQMNLGATSVSRASLAVSPQDPNYAYVMTAGTDNALEGVYRTVDGGSNWTKIINGGSKYFDPLSQVLTNQGQGTYDNVISVDPENKDRIFMGGVQMAEWSLTGGAKIIGSLNDFPFVTNYVHADKHIIEWDMTTNPATMIVGTDGGLYFSNNRGSTYQRRSAGFITTQFYGIAANKYGHVVGGTQDNGTLLINGKGNTSKSAVEILGGDGFDVAMSTIHDNVIFSSSYYGRIRRSANNGNTQQSFWDNRITQSAVPSTNFETQNWAQFTTIFNLWENPVDSSSRLFFAPYGQVWVAINPTDFSREPSWFKVSGSIGNGRILDMKSTPDGNSMFVIRESRLYRIDGLNIPDYDTTLYAKTEIPAGITTTDITSNLPGGRTLTSINLDPNNPNRAVVTLGNYGNNEYVYLTNNLLDPLPTFTSITGNLPKMPVYDATISIDDPNIIVIGTDLGVWATETAGTTWEEQNTGLGKVAVWTIRQYEWKPWEGPTIYAATHGRGFFKTSTYLTGITEPVKTPVSIKINAYPNPTSEAVSLSFETEEAGSLNVTVYDITGKIVYSNTSKQLAKGKQLISIQTNGWKTGNYFAKVSGAGYTGTAKISVIN